MGVLGGFYIRESGSWAKCDEECEIQNTARPVGIPLCCGIKSP